MFLHNPLNGVEPETSAFPDALGGEERFKDTRLDFRGNSGTVVADVDHNATVFAIGPNSKFARAAYGVNGLVYDVRPHLVQLAAKRIHQERDRLVVALHRHAVL